MDWTEENTTKLKDLVASGLSYSKIGGSLGCSKNAAIAKAHRLDLDPRVIISKPLKRNDDIYVQMGTAGCRYPIGYPTEPGFRLCGEMVREFGDPYCEPHHKATHVRPGQRAGDL